MAAPADELTELHAALQRGDWQRITDPLLWMLLLDQPDGWEEIVLRCSHALAVDAFTGDPGAVEQVAAWMREVDGPETERLEKALRGRPSHLSSAILLTIRSAGSDERRQNAYLPLVRRVVSRHPSPEREAALAVLERWPVE